MYFLITVGRYFGKVVGTEKIFCPHEKCVRMGEQKKYTVMVGLFFVPLLPAAGVKEWQCTSCKGRVVPNEGGKHLKNVLLFSTIVAMGGFAMFALFAYWALTLGGKNSAINPEAQFGAKVMSAFFAFLGLCLVGKALWDARRITQTLSQIVTLPSEKLAVINQTLEPNDNLESIASKLAARKFSPAEVQTYSESWCKPEP